MNNCFNPLDIPLEDLKGKNLIEASAGTGKTFCIENIYLRYLLEREDIDISEILVVTFTNAATKELKGRINNRLEQAYSYLNSNEPIAGNKSITGNKFYTYLDKIKGNKEKRGKSTKSIKRALSDFDEANIFTIHSFCEKVLTENAFESNKAFTREVSYDENKYIDLSVEDFWRIHVFSLPAEVYNKLRDITKDKTKTTEDKKLKFLKLDLKTFKAIAGSAVRIMTPVVIPPMEDYQQVEGLLKIIEEIKKAKTHLKKIYDKEKKNIEATLKKNLDKLKSCRVCNSLEEYFYDSDVIIFDEDNLNDFFNLHNIFSELETLNNEAKSLFNNLST